MLARELPMKPLVPPCCVCVLGCFLVLGLSWLAAVEAPAQPAELPRVQLLATGGTIAGGAAGALNAHDLVRAVPELAQVAALAVEDVVNIGSSRMTPEIQLRLARRVQ